MELSKEYIGQRNFWNAVRNSILPSWNERGDGRFCLVTGGAGRGKTFLTRALVEEISLVRPLSEFLWIPDATEVDRVALTSPDEKLPIDEIAEILERSYLGEKVGFFLDEVHKIKGAAALKFFSPLFLGAGEGWTGEGSTLLRGNKVPFNRDNLFIVCATNFKEKAFGGNTAALARRSTDLELELYSNAEMKRLIPRYLKEKGCVINGEDGDVAKIRRRLMQLNRGDFQALDAFLSKVDKKNVTLDTAIEALQGIRWTLRGFTWLEIEALKRLVQSRNLTNNFQSLAKKEIIESIIEGDKIEWQSFVSFAMNQTVEIDGVEVAAPFITSAAGGKYVATAHGQKFLANNSTWLKINS